MGKSEFGNKIRRVFIRHEPNAHTISVVYFDREKGQRHFRAQFYDKDHTIESVSSWVKFTDGIQLVCAISGKPI